MTTTFTSDPILNKITFMKSDYSLSIQVHYNIGKNAADKGRIQLAISEYEEALRYDQSWNFQIFPEVQNCPSRKNLRSNAFK